MTAREQAERGLQGDLAAARRRAEQAVQGERAAREEAQLERAAKEQAERAGRQGAGQQQELRSTVLSVAAMPLVRFAAPFEQAAGQRSLGHYVPY